MYNLFNETIVFLNSIVRNKNKQCPICGFKAQFF